MNREREIFLRALEEPSIEARAAFVANATAGDPELKQAVQGLFANDQADTFLEHGAAGTLRVSMEKRDTLTIGEEHIGDSIGRYKLLEKIGEGGFGIVYRAEQTEPVRRHVALKVIRVGMDTRSVVARFEGERQALALIIIRALPAFWTAAQRIWAARISSWSWFGAFRSLNIAPRISCRLRIVLIFSFSFVTRFSTPTRKGSFIATSSHRMSSSPFRTANRRRRSLILELRKQLRNHSRKKQF
jgi:hypothetical protein